MSFDVSHDQSMNMFAKIQFDKDLKPIGDHQQSAVNQISDVFSLNVISALDNSKF